MAAVLTATATSSSKTASSSSSASARTGMKREDKLSGGRGGGGGLMGYGYSHAAHIYPPGCTVGDLTWDEKVRTLKDFVATYRLPLVARVRSGDLSKFLPPCAPRQENAVQIHEVRRKKIVLARKLQWEKRQNDYIVSGEQVEVPASFKGWFEVVPDDGRPVEYFDTVGGICSIKPRRFLVRTSTVGYQLSIEDGVSCWMPHEIRPGEVLTTGMVYMDNNNNNSGSSSGKKSKGSSNNNSSSNNSTYASSNNSNNNNNANKPGFFKRLLKSSKNKNKPEQDLKYLQCFDADGREIMIPLIMSGVFSPVGDASMANYDAVYELQDLIMAFGLPVNAQLIHANLKEKASCPQGVLRLYGTREEELAVLSRVDKDSLIANSAVEKVEVSVDREISLQRGLPKRRQSVHLSRPTPLSSVTPGVGLGSGTGMDVSGSVGGGGGIGVVGMGGGGGGVVGEAKVVQIDEPPEEEPGGSGGAGAWGVQTEVALPKRVPKELQKKSKSSTNLLDKLSVRKVRKERAKLKELKSDDVFSKRIIRNDLCYEEFFNGLGDGDRDREEEGGGGGGEGKGGKNAGGGQDSSANASSTADTATASAAAAQQQQKQAGSQCGKLGKNNKKSKNNSSSKDAYGTYGGSTSGGAGGAGLSGVRKFSMQDRDLPPIPVESSPPSSGSCHDSSVGSRDSLYEHLPPAPQPPVRSASEPVRGHGHDHDHGHHRDLLDEDDLDDEDEDDGYMVPMSVRGGDSAYSSSVDVQLRRKPPAAPRDAVRFSRLKKCRSEILPPDLHSGVIVTDDGCAIDIDDLFSFTSANRDSTADRPYGTMASSQWAGSTSQLYGFRVKDKRGSDAVPAWRAEVQRHQSQAGDMGGGGGGGTLTRKSVDRLDLETESAQAGGGRSRRSRGQRMLDANATIRSHNLRGGKGSEKVTKASLMEIFQFGDSFRENEKGGGSPAINSARGHYAQQQNPAQRALLSSRGGGGGETGRENPYGARVTPSLMPGAKGPSPTSPYHPRPQFYVAYADSEPAFRVTSSSSSHATSPTSSYPRAASLSGHSDSAYPKQGDDSAISMGSRGDNPYAFGNNDSEYSYNEYGDSHHNSGCSAVTAGRPEDNWLPPDDISALSVQEVSRSLRYIGMKDRVVLRFANEQIDGNMLCSLDKRLLKEGFPELNALEIKKILDFVRGWRPKKK